MSKIGITLPGLVTLVTGSTLYPQPRAYSPKTYQTARSHMDGLTNMAQIITPPSVSIPAAGTGGGCSGVNQTFTSTGTFTAGCTGNLTFSVWGAGGSGAYNTGALAYQMGGGGAFAQSVISVTKNNTYLMTVATGAAYPSNASPNSFACPTSVAKCAGTHVNCGTTTGLSSSNFVCAESGQAGGYGVTAHSFGTLRSAGGGYAGTLAQGNYGGGGAGGPDGAGKIGTQGTAGSGGAGDKGSGGAGGKNGGTTGTAGTSNTTKGGGGGGGGTTTGGAGGAPGGGSGMSATGKAVAGANGEILVTG